MQKLTGVSTQLLGTQTENSWHKIIQETYPVSSQVYDITKKSNIAPSRDTNIFYGLREFRRKNLECIRVIKQNSSRQ